MLTRTSGYGQGMLEFEFPGTLIRWKGDSAWHFVYLPEDLSAELDLLARGMKGGWGSIKVDVQIGSSTWTTSLFPSKERTTYLLPVKAPVRKAEGIADGDEVDVLIRLV